MCVHVCVCVYVHVCMHVYMHVSLRRVRVCTSQYYMHVCMSLHAFVALSAIPVIILTYCVTKRWTTVEPQDGHTQKSSLKNTEVCFCDLKDNYALKLKCRPFHKRWLTFFSW